MYTLTSVISTMMSTFWLHLLMPAPDAAQVRPELRKFTLDALALKTEDGSKVYLFSLLQSL